MKLCRKKFHHCEQSLIIWRQIVPERHAILLYQMRLLILYKPFGKPVLSIFSSNKKKMLCKTVMLSFWQKKKFQYLYICLTFCKTFEKESGKNNWKASLLRSNVGMLVRNSKCDLKYFLNATSLHSKKYFFCKKCKSFAILSQRATCNLECSFLQALRHKWG